MRIAEAISRNKDTRAFLLLHKEFKAAEAIQLSNEALKFREDWEKQVKEFGFIPLPGETEE